jgi:hypothetical protein
VVAPVHHERLQGGDDDRGAEQLAGAAPGGLVEHRLELRENHVEVFERLLGQFDAVHDEQHPLGVARDEKAVDERGAQQRLPGARGHFEEELAQPPFIEQLGDEVDGFDLVAPQTRGRL